MELRNDEILQIHIGRAGIEIANPIWQLYSLEHGFNEDGIIEPGTESDNSFYSCSDTGKITPRSIMIDTQHSAINDIRLGPYRKLFDETNMIAGKYDSAYIYSRGYYRNSEILIDEITDAINSIAENCTNLQGFLIYRALGGGTGSGLGAQIMEHLDYCFPKALKYEIVNFPSPSISPSILEVYNSVLTTHATMELSDCTISIDNNSVHEICVNSLEIQRAGYKYLNEVIGQIITTFTSPFRLQSEVNCKYSDINCKLVPYPILHFPIISYAPMYVSKKGDIENLNCTKLTNLLTEPKYQLLKYNPLNCKYFSAIILYRGNLTLTDINETIDELIAKATNFINLKEMKFSLNNKKPIQPIDSSLIQTENDVCLLGNNSAIREAWLPIIQKFNIMLSKKAYLYHFISEGQNELDFQEAKNNMCYLMNEYKAVDNKPVEFLRQSCDFTNPSSILG